MSKFIHLSIPEPCSEDWEKMTMAEKGRHCLACQKTVIDFTHMSNQELVQFFKQPRTGSVCGRLNHQQLDQAFLIPRKRTPWLKYFFTISLPTFFFFQNKAQAQGKVILRGNVVATTHRSYTQDSTRKETSFRCFSGRVVDAEGRSVPYAAVSWASSSGIACDINGSFVLKVPADNLPNKISISAVGMESQEVFLSPSDFYSPDSTYDQNKIREIHLVSMEELIVLAGAIVVTRVVKHEKVDVCPPEPPRVSELRAFPNPAKAGEDIRIEFPATQIKPAAITLTDAMGKTVSHQTITDNIKNQQLVFSLPANLPGGIYFITVSGKKDQKLLSQQLVIQ